MKKVIILGGGLSGLSSAVFLATSSTPTLLLEASNRLGGRVSSFYDPAFKSVVDNGQHIMMGCYEATLHYLHLIKAEQNFCFQDSLEINFLSRGNLYKLRSGGIYPFSLLSGLLKFKLLSLKERRELLGFMLALPFSSRRDIEKQNALEWLTNSGQRENVIKVFWNTFVIGALNTTPEKASALLFRKVLMQVFYSGWNSSRVIIPDKPLTEAFCTPAEKFLTMNNSEVHCQERVIRLETDRYKSKIIRIVTTRRVITNFDYIISALPLYSLTKLIDLKEAEDLKPQYSTILTVHFKINTKLFTDRFIAVLDSPIHWIFKNPDHYTIVISNADDYAKMDNSEIRNVICTELTKLFKLSSDSITALRIIREKRATFVPSYEFVENRIGPATSYSNLFIAGDWTNSGLPATIEGAVLSGYNAANEVLNYL